jgi:YHS domain-containing protein
MNTLLDVLTAVSALSSQLYSSPSCNGPDCQSNSSAGATWSPSSNRSTDSRRYPQYSDPRQAAACQCRTCDPRFPCSLENCGRQNCQDCLNGCQNCAPGPYSSQANDGWEPRASDLRGRRSAPQVSVQRICPVTGEKLGSMGRPISVSVSGRTIQVCCQACVAAFKRNPEKYLQRVAEEIGAIPFNASRGSSDSLQSNLQASGQRLCPVTGEELGSMGPPIPVNASGRTIQVCCEACVAAVKRNPAKYFAKVADEIESASGRPDMSSQDRLSPPPQARVQRLCPVTGEELGSMGPSIPVTVSGRTIQVCCEACVAAVKRNPAKYFAKVEGEWNFNPMRPTSGRLMSERVVR